MGVMGISGAAVNQSSQIQQLPNNKPSKLTKGELKDIQNQQSKLYSNSDLGVLGVGGPRRANSMNQPNQNHVNTQGNQDLDVLENELFNQNPSSKNPVPPSNQNHTDLEELPMDQPPPQNQ